MRARHRARRMGRVLLRRSARALLPGLAAAAAGLSWTARAEVPNALEPEYSEAVLAHQSGEPAKALRVLGDLIRKDPQVPEFHELKALVLKLSGKENEAARAYTDLINLKRKLNRPSAELAPYYFELGVMMSKLGRREKSNEYLAFAVRSGFNPGPSRIYLGINAYQAGAWADAERHLMEVVRGGNRDLTPSAYLYLGQAYLKQEYASGATRSFIQARDISQAVLSDAEAAEGSKKLAEQTLTAAEQALKPYSTSQFFGQLSAISSYDSNALSIPTSVSSSSQTTGSSTLTEALSLGVGYLTPSLSAIQLVPSYRGGINYNTNRDTRSAEFASNTLSLYVTVNPLAATSGGLRLEGSFLFRDEVDTATDSGKFKKYSSGGVVAPFLKTELSRKVQVGGEVSLEPTKYYQDEFVATDSKRSGSVVSGSVFVQNEQGSRFWNPYLSFKYTQDRAEGREYKAKSWKVSVSDTFHLNSRLDLTPAVAYAKAAYAERPSGARDDSTLDLQAQGVYRWKPRLSLLASLGYTKNGSNIPATYEYNRFVVSFGASLTLF